MQSAFFTATAVIYGLSCASYLFFLFRGTSAVQRNAAIMLGAAVVSHIGFIATQYLSGDPGTFRTIHQLLNLLALGSALAFLVARRRQGVNVLGAFVTPVTLMLFLASGLGESFAPVSPPVRSLMLSLHVGANAIGIVAFALAFAASSAYVIQEYLLRHRQVGGVFQRLPALDILDRFSFRAVLVGFPLLTFGMVTGTFWTLNPGTTQADISISQWLGLITWLIFGAVLLLRVAAGWRGRRAALGTIMGFVSALGVLAGYVLRAAEGAGA